MGGVSAVGPGVSVKEPSAKAGGSLWGSLDVGLDSLSEREWRAGDGESEARGGTEIEGVETPSRACVRLWNAI